MVTKFLNFQTKTVTVAAAILISSAFLSRVLGLLRDRLLATTFGAGEDLDIYFASFRLPDFIYGIFVMAGVSAAFIPVFSEYFEKDKEKAWAFVNNLLQVTLGFLALVSVALIFFIPQLMDLIAPGFNEVQKEMASNLTRLMLLSPIFFGVSAIFSGVLQYFHRFFAFSLAPVLYNLGIILGIIFLTPYFGLWGVGIGVVAGAFLHAALQLPGMLQSGFSFKWKFNLKDEPVRKVLAMALPRTVATAGYHFNLIIMTSLASLLPAGSIAAFTFANNIQFFPVGLIGLSFAIASFPVLSQAFAKKNSEEFNSVLADTIRQITFFLAPAIALIFLLRAQIVRVLLGAGEFSWEDTRLTAAVLGIFAFGVLFQALIPLISRAYFAIQDTKTPTLISLVSVGVNVIFAFAFLISFKADFFNNLLSNFLDLEGIADIRILALPLAFLLSGFAQIFLLFAFLAQKVQGLDMKGLLGSFQRMAAFTILSGVSVFVLLRSLGWYLDLSTFPQVFWQLFVASSGGLGVYLALSYLFHVPELAFISKSIKKQLLHG